MREFKELTPEELTEISRICGRTDEDHYNRPFSNGEAVKYQLFDKTRSTENGIVVVRVYLYLQSIGVKVDV